MPVCGAAAGERAAAAAAEKKPRRPGGAVAGAGAGSGGGGGVRAVELAEARRRLLEVEARRRLVAELEGRVQQLHRALVSAELRLAGRAESLGRLGGGAAQAELFAAAHGQRLKKQLRRCKKGRPPALLASALALGSCVPWAAGKLRRGRPDPPDSPRRRGLAPA
ncbi:TMF-regulated nuclear protein 1 [Alligator mississippiensis]|uniref:TMF-regulated nuclear protein 1 n=1 Tax=Alligator mississippiensis TaxID=8496 RepID=UPI002877AB1E|nr:TMF-regulated nuclear protein 1 [Alligator mississippiensis]